MEELKRCPLGNPYNKPEPKEHNPENQPKPRPGRKAWREAERMGTFVSEEHEAKFNNEHKVEQEG